MGFSAHRSHFVTRPLTTKIIPYYIIDSSSFNIIQSKIVLFPNQCVPSRSCLGDNLKTNGGEKFLSTEKDHFPGITGQRDQQKMLPIKRLGAFSCLFRVEILLASFLNSNSHGNGHTDHGVVACAQEAHHLNVKSACRRLFACGAGTFGAGSQSFHKTRSTSHESGMLCFPSRAYLITSPVHETRPLN